MIKAFGRDEYINCEPEDLIPRPSTKDDKPEDKKDGLTTGKAKESGGIKDAAASQPKAKPDKKEEKKKEDMTSVSMQSGGFNSSILETSEDEEMKKKQQAKEEKKKKKGLTEAELNALVDIELCETETMTLIYMPSTVVPHDTEENGPYAQVIANNKQYDILINNKEYRGDNYNQRGS